ncbi:hypothetical protein [Lactobacillus crispatus]|uniref:hypothetical protein n=1 Tax=Lactobacillus crispatus TaxID=47770 RepID=UPI000B5DBA09|nr:hypothetical protein [Lactobacillus crispatus]OXC15626.1 hypothetical protein AYP78_00780 [Lactobacillus crispatus]OXC18000.1 hypothetical protein AYP79_05760 [Lactobacillus crispatus]OXC19037.1 hypothetical protein AYP80_09330 [Lactobacillus crispatus]
MAIKIVMTIFILLLLLTSWYMWHRRNGHFLIYDIGGDPRLSNILKWTSVALLAESILGIILLFMGNKYLNLITLFLASLTILAFGLSITQNKE